MKQAFFQVPPSLGNQYDEDRVLRAYLAWKLPHGVFNDIQPELQRMGERAVTDIFQLGIAAESNPPRHIPYDAFGKRVDHIEVSPAWKALDRIAVEEKLVAIGYERKHGAFSRVHQFAKLYLFHPSSAIYTCPLAMSDGAARALELYGNEELKNRALKNLISTDPKQSWTSGQWMTERTGGSDVSGTSTIAIPDGSHFRLYGDKWFTSATTSPMAMALARIEGAPEGSRGLSLFYLELRDKAGHLNGICINRLKDKLGTRALPTAELTLDGAFATLVGGPQQGVKKIASLFNITRIYNACCAVGYMRRGIALARDYATKRLVLGRPLSEHGLHLETLSEMQVQFEAGFHLVFHAVELLGKEEMGEATEAESAVQRLLTPLVKLYTAKQSIAVVSEALEAFGGAGYVEDTGLPRLLRDTQVLSIWEGTTNVLCLDALRAIRKENAAEHFFCDILARMSQVNAEALSHAKQKTLDAVEKLKQFVEAMSLMSDEAQQVVARGFSFSMAKTYAASLLLEHADWSLKKGCAPQASITARRWCFKTLVELVEPDESYRNASRRLALD